MSFFKPQVSFPLNFASPFNVMTHNSSEISKTLHAPTETLYALDKKIPVGLSQKYWFDCGNLQ